jgi:hypothetical protein
MAKTNWRTKTERALHIFKMAEKVGLEPKTWGDRSKVAKKFMPLFEKVEKYETDKFAELLPKITFRQPIPVREYGEIIGYI